jgi:large subunit ribosomal protein L32
MGALPKRKISKARKNKRRAHHGLKTPAISDCPKCGKKKRAHFECGFCGHYGGAVEAKSKAKSKKK